MVRPWREWGGIAKLRSDASHFCKLTEFDRRGLLTKIDLACELTFAFALRR